MTEMVDTSEIISVALFQMPVLTASVDDRMWAEIATPLPEYKPSQGPAICFKRRGGPLDYEAPILFPSYQFKIYGGEGRGRSPEADANLVYRDLVDALHHYSSYRIRGAELEGQGQTLFEPDSNWVHVLCFFQFQILS